MRFTKKDLEVFQVQGFADRMQLVADTIHPKLMKLGELLQPQLSRLVAHHLFPHVAQHLRRTVNPPDETWVAFGPDSKGYKNYVHFALCVGGVGVQARIMVKQECKDRKAFSQNLLANVDKLKDLKGSKEMADYNRRDAEFKPLTVSDWSQFLADSARRLKETQTTTFDIGINLPLSGDLSSHAIQAMSRLVPFYLLAGNNGNYQPLQY
ncbi:MAG: hypothetical protein A2W61_04890 [Deltaproteobacteria bacterium RIFCSPLOWO2_01_44_7]|nr:MAG: hypothetical protein A2712_08750 [Deltaproteobacteria bacterium RIFCSPHIGHO2_01_FULL_43_49]OGQ14574.1 MAG: hypothetical protein A3D22_08250 [Deltaproteobacteria bacterium RIFCSPHIGHO2_02_FULL_44_53]OGQ27960.1 MAG: hypothetical protein A3D98_06960 [Deltaproteobacteria bacterium RIFCSPHIGHO2_12_FULL_44_21]OGQ31172.1 MAG: hypothetical protein A2979_07010 [Deltaproteobacteria bacterium RIFCSPLOWO2_01_FULL_45_74]OGQ37890.1 MAG: hypothetical protein A2W61_04890 [Deltaproteobacteria bacterium 